MISELSPLPAMTAGDLVLVPGIDSSTLDKLGHVPVAWLRKVHQAGARICSVCSGAFALAHAGLLDGRECTTHWKVAERLKRRYPRIRLVTNRLFVTHDDVVTSAGVASGIDMALALLEEDHGPLLVARVAREMVVYLRRTGDREQLSAYLDYRTHLHQGIHRVQDVLVGHPEKRFTIADLAKVAAMSPRNLTRTFRRATGLTLKAFRSRVALQVARDLIPNPALTFDNVASSCGFRDARQLRRLWRQNYGMKLSEWRDESRHEEAH